jgi:hypothetical protein
VPKTISPLRRPRNIPVFLGLVVLGVTVALELGAARSPAAVSSSKAVSSVMNAYVHDDASIGLNFADGTGVGSQAKVPPVIPPGTYTINVVDDAYEHNFHLTGPGVDLMTPIDDVETTTWTVTLQPGSSYRFQCDAHPDFMWGAFTTSGTATSTGSTSSSSSGSSSSTGSTSGSSGLSSGSSTSTTSITGGSSPSPSLFARVSHGKAILAHTSAGARVTRLSPGRYRLDLESVSKIVLQQKGHAAKTLGRSTVLNLTAGTWSISAPGGAKSTFSVS